MALRTVDSTGITVADGAAVLADAQAQVDAKPALGPDFDDSPGTPFGQDQGAKAERVAALLALLKAIAYAHDPDSASGVFLDIVCAITGTTRTPASKSTVLASFAGTPSTVLPINRTVEDSNGVQWETVAEYTIGGGGTIAGTLRALATGPTYIGVSTDWTIVTSVSGWDTVQSTAEATIGADVETDAKLRARRKTELASGGSATIPAIAANLVQDNADITSAKVFENHSATETVDGIPPKAMEVLITTGGSITDDQIAEALHKVIPAATETHGSSSGQYTDGDSRVFTYKFSKPTSKNQWVNVAVGTTGATVSLPSDWQTLVEDAIVAAGNDLDAGEPVIPGSLEGVVWSTLPANSVTSVVVTISQDGVAYSSELAPILPREQAAFATARVEFV